LPDIVQLNLREAVIFAVNVNLFQHEPIRRPNPQEKRVGKSLEADLRQAAISGKPWADLVLQDAIVEAQKPVPCPGVMPARGAGAANYFLQATRGLGWRVIVGFVDWAASPARGDLIPEFVASNLLERSRFA
jgi:hypothetical protein